MNFKRFIESKEQNQVEKTLDKLPKVHRELVKNYKIKFTPKITLKNDPKHIGSIDDKEIIIAAPWNYGREFTTLHEIGHLIWGELLDKDIKTKWKKIVKKTKNKQNQNSEELFCMAYANYYSKNKITIHDHEEWNKFIKEEL
jgi:hypothetical protein